MSSLSSTAVFDWESVFSNFASLSGVAVRHWIALLGGGLPSPVSSGLPESLVGLPAWGASRYGEEVVRPSGDSSVTAQSQAEASFEASGSSPNHAAAAAGDLSVPSFRTERASRLWALRQAVVASGTRLLDWDEIRAEVRRRREEDEGE